MGQGLLTPGHDKPPGEGAPFEIAPHRGRPLGPPCALLGRAAAAPGVSRLQRTLRRTSVTAAHDLAHDATRHSGGFR